MVLFGCASLLVSGSRELVNGKPECIIPSENEFRSCGVKFYIIYNRNAMQNNEQAYQHALDYIYSFVSHSLTRNLRFSPEKFDLRRMVKFTELLGNPQDDYKIIHVAGTKGKGSTCAMLTSILTHAGYRTGFYSSPHLVDITEMFLIGDQQLQKNKFVEYVDLVKPYVAKVKDLTTFEIITGIALKYFSCEQVDLAVIEVGLGGRLDATNIVDPLISVITSISKDHMKILGDTLDKIAREKAGIIKPGAPVVVAKQKNIAAQAITAVAEEKRSPMINTRDQVRIRRKRFSLEGQYFSVVPLGEKDQQDSYNQYFGKDIFMPLLGDHQLDNAATAITVIQQLERMGYYISPKSVMAGFSHVKWPGRFEIISHMIHYL